MNTSDIPGSVFHALGWAMLHFLWTGAAVGLLVAIIERFLLRDTAPAIRYAFGLISLGLLAGIAGLCVWKMWPEVGHPVMAKAVPVVASVLDEIGGDLMFPVNREMNVEERTGLIGTASQSAAGPVGLNFDWIAFLPWGWLTGSTTLAAMLGFGFLGTVRLRRGASTVGLRRARVRCATLCERLGIRLRVGLAASERVVSPIVVGVFRPLIVLPASAVSGMPREMLEWILLHELAHVRRLDNAAILLQRVLECLLFFHPCVWLVSRWVDREREFCCDHFALSHNADCDPAGYAEVLARLAGVALPPLAPASAMASHAVVHRIRRVLNNRKKRGLGGGATPGGNHREDRGDDRGKVSAPVPAAAGAPHRQSQVEAGRDGTGNRRSVRGYEGWEKGEDREDPGNGRLPRTSGEIGADRAGSRCGRVLRDSAWLTVGDRSHVAGGTGSRFERRVRASCLSALRRSGFSVPLSRSPGPLGLCV